MSRSPSAVWVDAARLRPSRLAPEYYRKEYTNLEDELGACGQRLVHLGELGRLFAGPFGSELPASMYNTPDGVPLLRVQNIGDLFVNESDLARIPIQVHEELHRSKLEPGDLALAKAGRLGAVSRIPDHIAECNITQHIVGVKVNSERVQGGYLAAFFLARYGRFQLERQGVGTLIKYLGVEETRAAKIAIPDHRIQDYIGSKIQLAEECRRAAATIEAKLSDKLIALYEGCPSLSPAGRATTVGTRELDSDRIDAWHYQRHYIDLVAWLRGNEHFVQVGALGTLSADRWNPAEHGSEMFRYIEIADIDTATGHLGFSEVSVAEAPSRARKRVWHGDVLVSTVRPNRGAVAVVPYELHQAVATTGFAVVRPRNEDDAFFLGLVLRNSVSIAQLMRWNTGSTYPAIEEDVVLRTWIPGASVDVRTSLGRAERERRELLRRAMALVTEAKADVEALIAGTFDTSAVIAGTLKPLAHELFSA